MTMLFSRLFAVRRFVQSVRQMSDHGHGVPERFKHLELRTMNEGGYPLPTITYKEAYDRQNAKFNRWLVGSALWLISGATLVSYWGTFDWLAPPPRKVLDWGQEANE